MIGTAADPILVIDARAVGAWLVDADSRSVLGELTLAAAAPPPADLLRMPKFQMADTDVLGIRLGAAFEDADRMIRDYMAVGKVLTADRSTQLNVVGTNLLPYASGRIYVLEDETGMIAIYDEPPAAPGRVVGL
ncbi:hypothetical protein FA743_18125 [Paracoccus gahaiensis]|uniref:Uncharacterized protein n=1 Tax=Paracoccus gahaiensis TaxID=1706839 RepID=A0A4V5MUV8_9RHOB|nr:hypothetical protein [Paracoccus gahaiensis]TJZ89648.1 hypothetical protein FA743_18125 [Paracoccus gahaiensis]